MKTLLLFFAVLCIALTAQAQFTTGQKMIGGQFFGAYNENGITGASNLYTQTNINFSLSLSKFKSPTEYRSFGIIYGYNHTANGPAPQYFTNAHTIGVFVDRTKLEQLAKRFYFTYTGNAAVTVQFLRNTDKSTATPVYTHTNSYAGNLNGSIGLLYQVNQRFLFTCNLVNILTVGFSHATSGPGTAPTNNNIVLATGLSSLSLNSISIGAKCMLKK